MLDLEFVTVTGKPGINEDETSKRIRTQVMRDYLRKQHRYATTGYDDVMVPVQPENPSKYKGKFKLDTWSHKTKTKYLTHRPVEKRQKKVEQQSLRSLKSSRSWPREVSDQLNIDWTSADLDPFDSLAIKIGPSSQKLLVHCELKHLSSPQKHTDLEIRQLCIQSKLGCH
jgi:hypothetical protein